MTADAEPVAGGESGGGEAPAWRRAPEPRNLVPLLVEQAGPEYGLVWVLAARSELTSGAVFSARGSRWVVTGLSPSGVTFTCRELGEEARR
jgi:hypothetical protein